ncbi:MAG: hypothetical protein ABMA26_04715, partial [Limisphaerales bacterium]
IPLIAGSFACDLLTAAESRTPTARLLAWGAALMGIGYAISCLNLQTPLGAVNLGPQLPAGTVVTGVLVEPPFIPPSRPINLWTMSQRAGSVSYLVFATGFALAVLAGFVWACDQRKWQAAVLATFGTNALAGYLIHDLAAGALKPLVPRDAPGAFVLAALALFLWLCWLLVRTLERQRIHLRL